MYVTGYDTFRYSIGMTPQTTPRYARGYIYLLWGSLGYPKTEQKPNIPKNIYCCKNYNIYFYPCF